MQAAEPDPDRVALSREQLKISRWLKKLKFRRVLFGGVSEQDVWKRMNELNSLYEVALAAERARCDALIEQGATDLTIVSNNAGNGDTGLAALLAAGRVRKVICSFPRQSDSYVFDGLYRAGKIELEVVPQGTLAERMRAAGAGIGAFFSPTGVGTPLAERIERYCEQRARANEAIGPAARRASPARTSSRALPRSLQTTPIVRGSRARGSAFCGSVSPSATSRRRSPSMRARRSPSPAIRRWVTAKWKCGELAWLPA